MKELLRVAHARGNPQEGSTLKDYNMEISEGEILYIQGADGSGIREIASVLSGDAPLDEGFIYIGEEKINGYNREMAYERHFFPISGDGSIISNLTVAENMEALRNQRISLKLYLAGKMEKKVGEFLQSEGSRISADSTGGMLCSEEEIQLSILKAKLHGAELVILDVLNCAFEGTYAEEIGELIKKLCGEGISFILLSSSYSQFARIATRIQFVYRGRDLKEWDGLTGEVIRLLKSQNPDAYTDCGEEEEREKPGTGEFIGIYDYEWENDKCFWDFLSEVRSNNPVLWKEMIGAELPDKGVSFSGGSLVIPKESGTLWFENLGIEDNLLMPIAGKIAGSSCGMVRKNRREHVVGRFYDNFHIQRKIKEVADLSKAQRKLFSIYRFELLRPGTIFLENPYWGMDQDEITQIRNYLAELGKRGSRVIFCAKSADEMKKDCGAVIQTDNAKNARLIRL